MRLVVVLSAIKQYVHRWKRVIYKYLMTNRCYSHFTEGINKFMFKRYVIVILLCKSPLSHFQPFVFFCHMSSFLYRKSVSEVLWSRRMYQIWIFSPGHADNHRPLLRNINLGLISLANWMAECILSHSIWVCPLSRNLKSIVSILGSVLTECIMQVTKYWFRFRHAHAI